MSSRYANTISNFKRDQFHRLAFVAIIGVMLSHLFTMPCSMVYIGMFPASIMLGLDRFSPRQVWILCVTLLAGLTAGTLVIEVFSNAPYLASLCTYSVFLFVLKLFACRRYSTECYFFAFSYVLATISGSYPDATMESSILIYYPIQLSMVFFLVWTAFLLFPTPKPKSFRQTLPPLSEVPDYELLIYGMIWLLIWWFFMYFEWRFALFAFLSFMAAFRQFDRTLMKKVALDNIVVHLCCCSLASLFSLLLLGLAGNLLLLLLGISLIIIPLTYLVIYPPDPRHAYRYRTGVSAVLVPLILYLSTERAAVYQSMLRARLIVLLMIILYLVIEYLYYGVKVTKEIEQIPHHIKRRHRYQIIRKQRDANSKSARPNDIGSLPPANGAAEPAIAPLSAWRRFLRLFIASPRKSRYYPKRNQPQALD